MRHRRHTITVASSTLFFVCLMLHAQTRLYSQTSNPANDVEVYKVYESLLPGEFASREDLQSFFKPGDEDWKDLAKRYPNSARSYIVLSSMAFNMDQTTAVAYIEHSCDLRCGSTSLVLEKKDSIWESMRWRGTSRAWAS
jgi:hypothetical protein